MIENVASSGVGYDVEAVSRSKPGVSIKSPPFSRLAINQLTTYRWPLEEALTAYRARGFAAAGLSHLRVSDYGEEKAVELVRELRLAVSSLSWAGGFTGSDGSSFEDSVHEAREIVALAGAIGAENVIFISGGLAGHIRTHARRLVVDALRCLADAAAEAGTNLAILPMHKPMARSRSFLHTLEQALDVVDRVNRPAAKIACDLYHVGRDPILVDRIPELAPHLGLVQICDSLGAPRRDYDRLLPGAGDLPLAELLQAFDRAGYAGYYELNVWSDAVWRSNYGDVLRQCRSLFDAHSRKQVAAPAANS